MKVIRNISRTFFSYKLFGSFTSDLQSDFRGIIKIFYLAKRNVPMFPLVEYFSLNNYSGTFILELQNDFGGINY